MPETLEEGGSQLATDAVLTDRQPSLTSQAVMDRVIVMLEDLDMTDVELFVSAAAEVGRRKSEEPFELADSQIRLDLLKAHPAIDLQLLLDERLDVPHRLGVGRQHNRSGFPTRDRCDRDSHLVSEFALRESEILAVEFECL